MLELLYRCFISRDKEPPRRKFGFRNLTQTTEIMVAWRYQSLLISQLSVVRNIVWNSFRFFPYARKTPKISGNANQFVHWDKKKKLRVPNYRVKLFWFKDLIVQALNSLGSNYLLLISVGTENGKNGITCPLN